MSKYRLSIFGTEPHTSETYLLKCIYGHCLDNSKIWLSTPSVDRLVGDIPILKDYIVYHDDPHYTSKKEYHYELLPKPSLIRLYEDKLNQGFITLGRQSRFNNGYLDYIPFNPNYQAFKRQKHADEMKHKYKAHPRNTTKV